MKSTDPLERAFDSLSEAFRVKLDGGVVTVDVTALTDSIKIGDESGNLATTTLVGGKQGIDVNVIDITLDSTNDSVSVPGVSTSANQTTELAKLDTLIAKDFATQATLALIKAKTDNIDVALSTRTKPADTQVVSLVSTTISNIPHVIIDSMPAGGAGLTDTELRATPVLVSVSGVATATKQDSLLTELQLKADLTDTQPVSLATIPINAAAATSAKQDTLIAKDFATSAKQDTLIAKDFATQTTLALIKAKTDNLDAAASTLAKSSEMTTLNAKDFATQTTLALVKAKTDNIPPLGQALAAASTPVVLTAAQITTLTPIAGNLEATQLLVKAKTDNLDVALSTRLKPADTLAGVTTVTTVTTVAAVTAITNALPAGTNVIGSVNLNVKGTYRASTIIPLVAAVTVNVPFFNIIGSATKTVTIKRISVSGMTLTAVGYFTINAEKLSAASTGGTSTTLVATTLDTNNAAVTAIVKAYTVAPSKGALVGTLKSYRALWQATTAVGTSPTDKYNFDFGDINGSGGVVLRGVAQELALTFPVVLASAGTLAVDIEWTEE